MKIKKTYDADEYIILDKARFESYEDIDVVIGNVLEDHTECQLFDVDLEVCLLNTRSMIEVLEE